ncbi:MAG: hypothetical protein KF777_10405 [Planctomycetaceae bacterium]|nr:hypothetical protein [Planctomycetaceae bacterium]
MPIRFSRQLALCLTALVIPWSTAGADELAKPSPAETRPEMKRRLEALKERTSRIPLPELSEADRAAGRSSVNNGRLRSIYLPPSWQSFQVPGWGRGGRSQASSSTRPSNPLAALEATPGYGFKTRLFWIVSRANDCQYCLGHQELKLRRVGMSDDEIAALDSRWNLFPPAEQAAMDLTRKLTLTPDKVTADDIATLQKHFPDSEVIDLVYTIARYNAVNRWTSATGIPQDQSFGGDDHPAIDTPTSNEYASVKSNVAPFELPQRPAWEPMDVVNQKFAAIRNRKAVVELPSAEKAQQVLTADTPGVGAPEWFRAIADIPVALDVWRQRQGIVRDGKTDPLLRTKIAWVTARDNRAWYSAAHTRARYLAQGGPEAALASWDALLEASPAPGHAEALRFARKLTVAPQTIVDADIARLRESFSDAEVAEIIDLTANANGFDRYTEALQLRLEI